MASETIAAYIPFAEKACSFLSASPDPFHAVSNSVLKLEASGFVQLSKRDPFLGKIQPGGKYYYTINKSTLVAFCVGHKFQSGNGFKIIGGHTDSPNLKVKPRSKRSGSGCIQLDVECYGGGLWHTWFDRDLGISGRVLVREKDGRVVQKFVMVDKPVARVSSLCIHLQSASERQSFTVNKEDHLQPIIGTEEMVFQEGVKDQLNGFSEEEKEDIESCTWKKEHEPQLLKLIASELQISVKDIADFELNLFDTQKACLGGIQSEFLYSARLDNLATVFVSVEALLAHSEDSELLSQDEDISLVALFDHEEVGSNSAHGAASPVMAEAVKRISTALQDDPNSAFLSPDVYSMSIRKSFVFSVDQAHAVHPNYSSKHEKAHAPKMNSGVVIKNNQNQRYATNSVTGYIVRELTRKAGISPVQEFVVRNDCPCGSTIGPIISTSTGIRTVDAGMPQLSMHSCREVMGIVDLTNCLDLFKAFFKHFREVDDALEG
eukprot:CAMPEP_0197824796 /NCGR_PEP_ID=MMETSP1437-20131217/2012_1 /TAXON_ID=49252 ORGANISM="Eucampia antarctica, Strain CCMP1452" /NCGR_SAMPLE_ID=MMETSP1437 /ASSEMBLY_ACC=CAM_ASM_001096 /LENGTH=490 /DNA_ID=CAMNT_0043424567 /DNA_START=8 /DNA_END=1480 /DNA_ORIENTATION=+